MGFKGENYNSATMESGRDMKSETERLRKENEEKIKKMKEREENRGKEEAAKKEEEIRQKREKYSQEFQRKPLNVEKVNPKGYTHQMQSEDFAYLDGWMQYEFGRFDWLMSELDIETKRRTEMATTAKDLQEIRDWHYEQVKQTHKYLDDKKKEIWALKERVMKTFLYKEDPNDKKEKEAEQKFNMLMRNLLGRVASFDFKNFKDPNWQRKADEYQKDISTLSRSGSFQGRTYQSWEERLKILQKMGVDVEDFLRKADEAKRKKPGNGGGSGGSTGPERPGGSNPEKDKAEEIACEELGISNDEYRMIVGKVASLSDADLVRLTTKVLGCSNEKSAVKKAYYKCAKDWHPDTGKTKYGIGVNEIKFKIANNLYGEYNNRFAK